MRSVDEIIALLGGPDAAATRLGIGTEAVRKWRQARAIPPKHWPAILAAAGLTLADLSAPASPRPETAPVTDIPEGEASPRAPPGH